MGTLFEIKPPQAYPNDYDTCGAQAKFVKMARAMDMEHADKPQDFITALGALQEACGVADWKISNYGFTPDEFMTLAKGTRSVQGGLFAANPCEMNDEDCSGIFEKSYR